MKQTAITEKESLMAELRERALVMAMEVCDPGHGMLVWGEGSLAAKIVLVGEAPGEKEEAKGHPFVGPAGKTLDRELERLGLDRDKLWITNVVKCRPVKVSGRILSNRAPTTKEASRWLGVLMEEIEIIHPKVIVCLGAVAAKSLIDKDFALVKQHGQWFDGPSGTKIIAAFHPAYILRQTGDNRNSATEAFHTDLEQAQTAAKTEKARG